MSSRFLNAIDKKQSSCIPISRRIFTSAFCIMYTGICLLQKQVIFLPCIPPPASLDQEDFFKMDTVSVFLARGEFRNGGRKLLLCPGY